MKSSFAVLGELVPEHAAPLFLREMENFSRPIPVLVECYAGYRGEQSPTRFTVWDQKRVVVEEIDRWLAPDFRYFKVLADDGATYILRHNVQSSSWELTLYQKAQGLIQ